MLHSSVNSNLDDNAVTCSNCTNNRHQEQIDLYKSKSVIYWSTSKMYIQDSSRHLQEMVNNGLDISLLHRLTHDKDNTLGFLSDVCLVSSVHKITLGCMSRLAEGIQVLDHEFTFIHNGRDFTNIAFHLMLSQIFPQSFTECLFVFLAETLQVVQLLLTKL